MNNENLNINKLEEEEGGFDFKIILMKLIIYWKWFVVSIVLCLLCAFVYLRNLVKWPNLFMIKFAIISFMY